MRFLAAAVVYIILVLAILSGIGMLFMTVYYLLSYSVITGLLWYGFYTLKMSLDNVEHSGNAMRILKVDTTNETALGIYAAIASVVTVSVCAHRCARTLRTRRSFSQSAHSSSAVQRI
jgi:hypothetical protein